MIKRLDETIPFHAYPVAAGGGYRCFDGEKWYDCDKGGNPKVRKPPQEET